MTDTLVAEVPTLTTVDRSTLERFSECPAQAQFVAQNRVMTSSHLAEVGSAIHAAFGEVVTEYVESRGSLGVMDIVDTTIQLLSASRPDVQADALKAARPSLWAWAKYLNSIHHQNVLRWDGGEGEHSGQLAHDIEDLNVRVTSEVDFLHTGRATELVTEVDFKSGWKNWTSYDVEHSFQFAMHAWLLFENYPEVEAVQVRVWNNRLSRLTYSCVWNREKDLYPLQYKIRAAVQNWMAYKDSKAEDCPTWATQEKCSLCPAAALCPAVPQDIKDYVADHDGLIETIVSTRAKLDALEKIASGIVEATGKDIIGACGSAFGINKPKKERKPSKLLYAVASREDDDAD